jgi:hypothetical protein
LQTVLLQSALLHSLARLAFDPLMSKNITVRLAAYRDERHTLFHSETYEIIRQFF